jgi:hypothetical protein
MILSRVQRIQIHVSLTMVLALSLINFFSTEALGGALTVHVGPPAIGSGGPNPISIPPLRFQEYEVTYVTASKFESNISVTPGLLFGTRYGEGRGVYYGLGGGLVINGNGVGPGVYSSVGLNLGETYKFNIEYKQALGVVIGGGRLISPYAVRLGMTFDL